MFKIHDFSSSGWSPLLLAASYGHLDLVKIFLDVNARVDVFDQVLLYYIVMVYDNFSIYDSFEIYD